MVIDTVNDFVIGDIDDKIVNTGGVAVRPFWWGNEYLEELGLKTYTLASGETTLDKNGSEDSATGEIETGTAGALDRAAGSKLNSALLVIVTMLSLLLLVATAFIIKLSAKKKMISTPTAKNSIQTPQPPPQSHDFPSFCANCGNPLTPGSNFCPGCGEKILEH